MPLQPAEFISELKKSGRRMRALKEKRYLKSNGEFFGVTTPVLRKLTAPIAQEFRRSGNLTGALRFSRALWQAGVHESKTSAILIVAECERMFDDRVWDLGRNWLDQIDNWGHCDGIAPCLLAPFVQSSRHKHRSRRREVLRWTKNLNPWVRRGALLTSLRTIRTDKEHEFVLALSGRLIADDDYFVQKGLGWMLRECAHHNPREVISFIQLHRDQMRRSTVTNAVSRLPKTLQAAARNG